MTTLGSWIDDEALAQVIRELCPDEAVADPSAVQMPVAEGEPSAEESVPLESLPPAVPSSPAAGSPAALVNRLAAVKQRAQRSGLIGGAGKTSPTHDPNPFAPPADTLAVRLEYLGEWIRNQFNLTHLCLSDSRGESLTLTAPPVGLAAGTAVLADALQRSQTESVIKINNALHAALEDGQVLTVIAAPTGEGLFSISVIGAAPLSRRDVETCRNAFYAAIDVSVTA